MLWIIVVIVIIGIYFFIKYQSIIAPKTSSSDISILPEQFIIVDIETTGLDPEKHEIIEIGAIKVNRDSNNHKTWTILIKPQKKVTKKITDITGITPEMLELEGHTLKEGIEGFLDFAGGLRLVAFNAPFDIAFLTKAAGQFGKPINNPVSCALDMARRAWPGLKSYKLKELAKQGNFDTTGMNRALADCRISMSVYAAAATKIRAIS